MSRISFDSTSVSLQHEKLMRIEVDLIQLSQRLEEINCGLDWRITVGTQIKESISRYCNYVALLKERSSNLDKALTQIIQMYERTEKHVRELAEGDAETQVDGASAHGYTPTQTSKSSDGSTDGMQDSFKNYRDLVKVLSKLLKVLDDSERGKFFAGMFALAAAVLGGFQPGATFPELYKTVSEILSSGTGAIEKVYELFDRKEIAGRFGLVSDIIGLSGSVGELYGKNWDEALQDSGDVISDAKDLGKSIYEIRGGEVTQAAKEKLAAVVAIASMLTRACGDVHIYWSDDGKFDANDASTTMIDTGVTGATSLIKAASLGIISIDTDKAVNTYKINADRMAQIIHDTGASTTGQVLMTIPGAAITVTWSTLEVVKDYGVDTWNKIRSVFDW